MEEFLFSIQYVFTNRELALLSWLIILTIAILLSPKFRVLFVNLIKALLRKKLIIIILTSLIYISFIVFVLYKLDYWNTGMLKDTIWWSLATALILLFKYVKTNQNYKGFMHLVLDSVKLIAVVEFFTNLYSFTFLTEMFLIPVMVFLVSSHTYSQSDLKYAKVTGCLTIVISVIGFYALGHSIYEIVMNFSDVAKFQTVLDFLLPIVMTIMYIPFLYAMAFYIKYKSLCLSVDLKLGFRDRELAEYAKKRLLKKCGFRLSKLFTNANQFKKARIVDKQDFDKLFLN